MPLKLDFKRAYSTISERVKCCDLHQNEPWMLVSLYSGQVQVHNYETQTQIKVFNTGQAPVRAAKFISRKNWIICGSDDLLIRVFNYNTLEKVAQFEAHTDYIRCILVHPIAPLVLTSSDDMTFKVFDWERKWECIQTFEGHSHYVMQLAINPKDLNQVASASLDKKVKVWQLGGSNKPNFTLEGHEKGVNCVDYCHSGDKPYLISAADDWYIKVWDYQNKSCVHTLSGHSNNVVAALFHPTLPIIISGSEDGSARIWNLTTFKNESTFNYGMGRLWCISVKKESNEILFGFDDGALLMRIGREFPASSMDSNGKLIVTKQNCLHQASVKNLDSELKNGERLSFSFKEFGACEIYPHLVIHSPNSRYLAVLGEGEYVIYTTVAFRSKIFGNAESLAWSQDSTFYAIKDGNSVKVFKNFKEFKKLSISCSVDDIYGGALLGVKYSSEILFYEWSNLSIIMRIEAISTNVYWNPNSTLCCLCTENNVHLLKYRSDIVENSISGDSASDSGVEGAFELISDLNESVCSGLWIGDCFVFTNKTNRVGYMIGHQVFTLYHLEKQHFLIGYHQQNSRIFLTDKEGNIISYLVDMSIMEYEVAIICKDFEAADKLLLSIPSENRERLATFLENNNYPSKALEVTTDTDHRFELALSLNNYKIAYDMALLKDEKGKWQRLGRCALNNCQYSLAVECYKKLSDCQSLLLLAVSLNNSELLEEALTLALRDKNMNIAFLIYYITGKSNKAIDTLLDSNMFAEAAFMSYSYDRTILGTVFDKWKQNLSISHAKQAELLASPISYPNLFPDLLSDVTESMNLLDVNGSDKTE